MIEAPEACPRWFCGRALPTPGSGFALGDVNGDGLTDILALQVGPRFRDLGPLRLLRNEGAMRWTDITASAGLQSLGARVARFSDLDRDGDEDLILGGGPLRSSTEAGVLYVLRNDRGRFTLSQSLSFPSSGAPIAIDLADFDHDGNNDIFVAYGGTRREGDYPTIMIRGRAGGNFAVADAVSLDDQGFAWVACATDVNRDGALDVITLRDGYAVHEVPHDPTRRTTCQIESLGSPVLDWRNGVWINALTTRERSFRPQSFDDPFESNWFTPMGVGISDFNHDGLDDYIFSLPMDPALFLGLPGGRARPVAVTDFEALAAPGAAQSGWSVVVRDLTRDGIDDVFFTWGVIPTTRSLRANLLMAGRSELRFEAVADTGLEGEGAPWSAALFSDLDGDGDDDALLGAQTLLLRPCDAIGSAWIFENRAAPRGHWIRMRLRGTVSSPDAVGARVELTLGDRRVIRVVRGAGVPLASSDLELDWGLRSNDRILQAYITWPSGARQGLPAPAIDQRHWIVEPAWLAMRRVTPESVLVTLHTEGLDRPDEAPALVSDTPGAWIVPPTRLARGRWEGLLRSPPGIALRYRWPSSGITGFRRTP